MSSDVSWRATCRGIPPGSPNIVVRNMAGAGGILATKYLYSVAPKDGTALGALVNTTPFEPLFGTKEATFDPTKTSLASIARRRSRHPRGVERLAGEDTLEDARRHETTVGAAGINSTPSFYARMMNTVAGTKLKIVTGYPDRARFSLPWREARSKAIHQSSMAD